MVGAKEGKNTKEVKREPKVEEEDAGMGSQGTGWVAFNWTNLSKDCSVYFSWVVRCGCIFLVAIQRRLQKTSCLKETQKVILCRRLGWLSGLLLQWRLAEPTQAPQISKGIVPCRWWCLLLVLCLLLLHASHATHTSHASKGIAA